MRESDIEKYLLKRVWELGGEVRKVKWIGRAGAPDRFVMLPEIRTNGPAGVIVATGFWVELKAPGKAATFPADAHERAQRREHERLRKFHQRVEVVDSFERVEEVLK